jgi:hypothetical protein
MYVGNFIIQNTKFFRSDRLINQWLALLDSRVDPQANVTAPTQPQSNDVTENVDKSLAPEAIKEVTEISKDIEMKDSKEQEGETKENINQESPDKSIKETPDKEGIQK